MKLGAPVVLRLGALADVSAGHVGLQSDADLWTLTAVDASSQLLERHGDGCRRRAVLDVHQRICGRRVELVARALVDVSGLTWFGDSTS